MHQMGGAEGNQDTSALTGKMGRRCALQRLGRKVNTGNEQGG